MGNCIIRESAREWAGEDWGSPAEETFFSGNKTHEGFYEKAKETIDERVVAAENEKGGEAGIITEVKIKITKKQLEELLGRVDVKGLSVEEVMDQLMRASDVFETSQRPWRPVLQSIPELN